MANSITYNYRFYSKTDNKVTKDDYQYLFDIIFNYKEYKYGELSSYSVPMIFELDPNKEYIEFLIEPYKNTEFYMLMDDLIESNKYDVWIRSMNDSDYIDRISFNNNGSRVCKYKYDKIKIYTNSQFDKTDLYTLDIIAENNQTVKYEKPGEYHSAITLGRKNEKGPNYFENRISLANKYKMNIAEYGKLTDCSEWFSDQNVYFFCKFLKYKKGFSKIEFFSDERIVRLYDSNEMGECYMMDDWDNCVDELYIEYKRKRNYR